MAETYLISIIQTVILVLLECFYGILGWYDEIFERIFAIFECFLVS
jgi:hypothetical protein